jgi:hypothetical protein
MFHCWRVVLSIGQVFDLKHGKYYHRCVWCQESATLPEYRMQRPLRWTLNVPLMSCCPLYGCYMDVKIIWNILQWEPLYRVIGYIEVPPINRNIHTTMYLTRHRQAIINIEQFSWKIELSCCASVIDTGDYFSKHWHDPNGFYFDWWNDWIFSWLLIERHWTVLLIESNKEKTHCSHWNM